MDSATAMRADREEKFIPGQPDMWAFILFESCVFTAYFAVYLYYRKQDVSGFLASQAQLDLGTGVINTLVLLLSSWSMARCVQAAREGNHGAALNNVMLTVAFALAFVVSKVGEWAAKIDQGLTFTSDEFFSFYYFFTIIHFIHLLIGFLFLGIAWYQLAGPARRSQELIETSATYWHMVDFLWVMIFALLYVLR